MPMEELVEIYIQEIEQGIGDTGIKAGAVKIATGDGKVSDYERKLVTAGVTDEQIETILVDNPKRLFSCALGHQH